MLAATVKDAAGMATGDRTMDAEAETPEEAGDDEAEVQTQRIKAAVPPRPVSLPPRPSGLASVRPPAALSRLSDGPPRERTSNGQAPIPAAPRVPAGPPPLPPVTGLASARPRGPAHPPPLPARPSAPPPPPTRALGSVSPPPPPASEALAARAKEERHRALELEAKLRAAQQALAARDVQLTEAQQALAARDSELRDARAECLRLRSELAEREEDKQRLLSHAASDAELRARIAELERTSVDLSSRLAESEIGLGRAESRVQELEQELASSRVHLRVDGPPAPQPDEVAPASVDREAPPAPAASGPVQVSPEDNLKKIRGIGPKFERALKAAGVRTFAQIAALGDEGLRDLARTLRISPDRIRREGWIERAQELRARTDPAGHSRSSG